MLESTSPFHLPKRKGKERGKTKPFYASLASTADHPSPTLMAQWQEPNVSLACLNDLLHNHFLFKMGV
jgi:hypothetical protein